MKGTTVLVFPYVSQMTFKQQNTKPISQSLEVRYSTSRAWISKWTLYALCFYWQKFSDSLAQVLLYTTRIILRMEVYSIPIVYTHKMAADILSLAWWHFELVLTAANVRWWLLRTDISSAKCRSLVETLLTNCDNLWHVTSNVNVNKCVATTFGIWDICCSPIVGTGCYELICVLALGKNVCKINITVYIMFMVSLFSCNIDVLRNCSAEIQFNCQDW